MSDPAVTAGAAQYPAAPPPSRPSAITLRPYQHRAVSASVSALRSGGRSLLVMPTGSGKTVTAADIVREMSVTTLVVAHRREIILQTASTMRSAGLDVGVILAGEEERRGARVQVASIQTLARRELPSAELLVIDEAHHVRADTYGKILAAYRDSHLLGLTATPFRLDGRGLGETFSEIIVGARADELVSEGYLIAPVVFAPSRPDMSRARILAGDYRESDQYAVMGSVTLIGKIVETWTKRAHGRRTVVFAVNVAHSQELTVAFTAAGIRAAHLDGTTPKPERDRILERLADGDITVVSTCMVLTEGWDLPALEVAVIARPTASLNLHLQMLGRVMRAAPGKLGAVVLDHSGNHHLHGDVAQHLEYNLDDAVVKVPKPGGGSSRTCPECGLVAPTGAAQCGECGHVWPVRQRDIESVDGDLTPFSPARLVPPRPFEELRAAWDTLESRRRGLGFKVGWSEIQYKERFGSWPNLVGRELVDPRRATTDQRKSIYLDLAAKAHSKGWKIGWAYYQFQQKFGVRPDWSWRQEFEEAHR